jgi:hypothetical protein
MINTNHIRLTPIKRRGRGKMAELPPGHVKASMFRLHLADYLRAQGTFIVHKHGQQFEITIKRVAF